LLQAIGLSAAYQVEMAAFIAQAPQALVYGIRDLNGAVLQIDLKEQQFADTSWINGSFAQVRLTDELNPLPPYPSLILAGGAGRIDTAQSGPYDETWVAQWRYRIDAVVMAESSDPESAQRLALMMLMAFDSLIERNQQLGGLVQLIHPETPAIPGGSGKLQASGHLAGAMLRYGADVLVPRP
jgi:hypothetical protein